jgi:hypothetical protein
LHLYASAITLYTPISMLSIFRDVLRTGVVPYRIPLPLPRRENILSTPISMLSIFGDVLRAGVELYRIPPPLPRRENILSTPISMLSVVRDVAVGFIIVVAWSSVLGTVW